MTVEHVNPNRYPKHKDRAKGQVHNGECNRTACTGRRATYWNTGTFGFYCRHCAFMINRGNEICIAIVRKPTVAEQVVMNMRTDEGRAVCQQLSREDLEAA